MRSPLLSFDEAIPGVLCLVLGSPVQERHGTSWENPIKSHKDDKRIGASLLWGNAELGLLSPEQRRLREDLFNVYRYLMWEGVRRDRARLFPLVPSGRTRDNGHKLTHRRFCLNIINITSLLCVQLSTYTGCPERWWVSMLEDIQEPSGHGSVQAAADGLAWAVDCTRWPLGVHSSHNHSDSVTLWNYKSGSIASYRGKSSIIWYFLQVFWCLLYSIGLSDIVILSFHLWHQCYSLYSCCSL